MCAHGFAGDLNWVDAIWGDIRLPNTILIIEDDDDTAAYVSEALLHEGFSVERCNDGVSGLERKIGRAHV